ncbi:phosphate signaling complex protein PhoU [Clostridium algidicarnis]|uniref:phosphate signaling complex protein PhoU n=1 Tax=Clostridium algidicarnis TaxID=37659 RepID=UPI001C0C81B3|nr:phosphate signaling complex protein PhoU [Clostridium algidicarnis]MBU3195607.1 phosphate signaling complex protein PhoU [Clostridium algidicarnis]MBU3208655.1 phosphate signaling complex protein PhoU [Clostridium algidicarnis]MBU3226838.1 phosphate signaling complex protein PhoU [Clostridium algidicarnis]MBU3250251.1 phosphate signaling complex protein PhoU [Clostridium algidicarnis]
MTRRSFDTDLKNLHMEVLRMGSIVEKQIHLSIKALEEQDENLSIQVIKQDDLVDDLEREIEDKCIKLIAMQQPLAKDLRNIFTTIKIVTDLERMADHAVDIAKIVIRLKDEKYIRELTDIPRMSLIIQQMIRDSLDAYINADSSKAYAVCKMDDEIDDIYENSFTELLNYIIQDKSNAKQATQFLFVFKFLERIADHVTNICEWTIYLVTGETVDLND